MKMKGKNQTFFFILLLLAFASVAVRGGSEEKPLGGFGGITGAQNSAEIEDIGRFAVEEHNRRQNSVLEFGRVVKAKEQVVAGKVYVLTLEAIDAGKKKLYEAKVWVQPWMNSKLLEEFKQADETPSDTSSDLGAKRGR